MHFNRPCTSSDGRAVLLEAADERLDLTARLGACLAERRDPGRIRHSMTDLVRRRVFGIATGYEDCNDAARLIDDPMPRLLLDRDPVGGALIASQPTLYRFEVSTGRWRLGVPPMTRNVCSTPRGTNGLSFGPRTNVLPATQDSH